MWVSSSSWAVPGGGKSTDPFMRETINNFNVNQDVIDLPQSLFANFAAVQADMHASGSSTIIIADANDVITLNHVSITSLRASNFHFLV